MARLGRRNPQGATILAPIRQPDPYGTNQDIYDLFDRSVTDGWGTSTSGHTWTIANNPADFDVDGAVGTMSIPTNSNRYVFTGPTTIANAEALYRFKFDALPSTGSLQIGLRYRIQDASNYYRTMVFVTTGGALQLLQQVIVANSATAIGSTLTTDVGAVPGVWYWVRVRYEDDGSGGVNFDSKAWRDGAPEPAYTDTTKAIQRNDAVANWSSGQIGFSMFNVSGNSTHLLTYDNFNVNDTTPAAASAHGRGKGRATATGNVSAALITAAAHGRARSRATSTSTIFRRAAAHGRADSKQTAAATIFRIAAARGRAHPKQTATAIVTRLAQAHGRAHPRQAVVGGRLVIAAAHGRSHVRQAAVGVRITASAAHGRAHAKATAKGGLKDLIFHVDASRLVGLSDTDPVATWNDLSVSGWDVTQSNSTFRPTYQTNETNGLPIVRFDGTDDRLENSSLGAALSGTDVPFTVIAAVKPTLVDGNNRNVFATGNTASATPGHQLRYPENSNRASLEIRDDAGTNKAVGDAAGGTVPINTWAVVTGRTTGTVGTLYRNGVLVNDPDTDLDVGQTTLNIAAIGAWRQGASASGLFIGDMGEILVFSSALSDAEREAVESYLTDKWLPPVVTATAHGRADSKQAASATVFRIARAHGRAHPRQQATGDKLVTTVTAAAHGRAHPKQAAASTVFRIAAAHGRAHSKTAALSVVIDLGQAHGRAHPRQAATAAVTQIARAHGRSHARSAANGQAFAAGVVVAAAHGRNHSRAAFTATVRIVAAAHGRAHPRQASAATNFALARAHGRADSRSTTVGTNVRIARAHGRAHSRATSASLRLVVTSVATRGRARARTAAVRISIASGQGRAHARSASTGSQFIIARAHGRARGVSKWISVGLQTGSGTGFGHSRSHATGGTDLEFLAPTDLEASYVVHIYASGSYEPAISEDASYEPAFAGHAHGGIL